MDGYRSYGPQPYQTDSVWSRVERGFNFGNALRNDFTARKAGAAIAGGDLKGASNALLMNGNLQSGLLVQQTMADQQAKAAAGEASRKAEALKYTEQTASRLAEIHRTTKDPQKTVQAFDQYFAQGFRDYGDSEEEIAQLRTGLMSDPETTLMALGAGAAKEAGAELRTVGDEVLAFREGKLIGRWRGAKTATLGPDSALVEIPGSYGDAPADPAAPAGPSPMSNTSQPDIEAVWEAAKMQESGGRGDAVGPETPYGRAYGSTQMLPATAEAMARKLGIRWDPRLMRENTPQALAYQDRLGRAYFEEGLQKYGNVEDALRYYHGGPNEDLWGPKTEAHVRAVMGRVQPYDVASSGDTPAPSGVRVIARGPPKPKEQQAPSGYRFRGDRLEPIPGGPADPIAQQTSGKTTEGERTAGFLASRLADSLKNLTIIRTRAPEADKPGLMETAAGAIGFGMGPGAANLVRDTDRQQVIANQLDVLDTALTLGTGAAYNREQLENYRSTYFPFLTDKPETVEAKRQKLLSLLRAAKIKAGNASPPELDQAIAAAVGQGGGGQNRQALEQAPPRAAVDLLRREPTAQRRQQFDQVFGPGAAAKVLGGK